MLKSDIRVWLPALCSGSMNWKMKMLSLAQQKGKKLIALGKSGMADRVTQLAIHIADDAARCDIEILCAPVGGEPSNVDEIRACWFDLHQLIDPSDAAVVQASAEYLACRGLLVRHPVHANWVRPRHAAAEAMALNEVGQGC
jgi:hypothetical protein